MKGTDHLKLELLTIKGNLINLDNLLPTQMTGVLLLQNGLKAVPAQPAVHAGIVDHIGVALEADLAAVVEFGVAVGLGLLGTQGEEVRGDFVLNQKYGVRGSERSWKFPLARIL